MSIELNFPFTVPGNYTYDPTKIAVSGGKASLVICDCPGVDFNQPFDSDTGFTYDSDKAEFTGGLVRQKDQRQTDATFGATYTNNINGNWGNGTLTGAAVGGASVASGKLDLAYGDLRYVDYNADLNADSQQEGAVRVKYTPNYSGSPASAQCIFTICETAGSTNNLIEVRHLTTGKIGINIYNSAGTPIVSYLTGPTWSPTSSTDYELELNWDITSGETTFYIDGSRYGAAQTATGTRGSSIGLFRLGSRYNATDTSNFKLDDVLVFSTSQHSGVSYTPGYSVSEYSYLTSTVILPEMEYTGAGSLQEWTAFTTTDANSPRYTIQVGRSGNYLYWDGAAWSVSDGTYAQANSAASMNTNAPSLDIEGEIYGQFKIHFNEGDSQMSVSDLTATVVGQTYNLTNPTIEGNTDWRHEGLEGFIETATKSGSDEIKYVLKKGTSWYYHNGSTWTTTDGATYAESNTAAEIEAAKATFTTEAVISKFKAFLHADTGITTPELDNLQIDYNFSGDNPDTVNTCTVWGYSKNADNTINTERVTTQITDEVAQYKTNTTLLQTEIGVIPNSTTGYWELELIENVNMDGTVKYKFKIDGLEYIRSVPNESTKNFWELT
jgi:hypothetical protein